MNIIKKSELQDSAHKDGKMENYCLHEDREGFSYCTSDRIQAWLDKFLSKERKRYSRIHKFKLSPLNRKIIKMLESNRADIDEYKLAYREYLTHQTDSARTRFEQLTKNITKRILSRNSDGERAVADIRAIIGDFNANFDAKLRKHKAEISVYLSTLNFHIIAKYGSEVMSKLKAQTESELMKEYGLDNPSDKFEIETFERTDFPEIRRENESR